MARGAVMRNTYSIENVRVTVVTVTYNSSAFVRDAIESVLAQTHDNIEYIIGDDHSSDNTWELIREYNDSRIIAYRNEKNMGEYANRNKAIQMATGKYLIFIDGDDLIYPHGIAYFTSQMEEFPQAAYTVQKGYTSHIVYPALLKPVETLKNFYFGKFNLLTSSFASNFFNTEILKSVGGLSMQYVTADEEIRLRLAAQFPVLFVQGWVSWPRETPGQASSRIYDGTGYIELIRMTKEVLNSGRIQDPVVQQEIMTVLKKNGLQVIKRSIKERKIRQALRILKLSGFGFVELLGSSFKKLSIVDPISQHHPANPLKPKRNERIGAKVL